MKHASERLNKNDCFIPEIVLYKNVEAFKENCYEDNSGKNCLECWHFHDCRQCCEMEDWEKVFNDLRKHWRKKKLEKLLS